MGGLVITFYYRHRHTTQNIPAGAFLPFRRPLVRFRDDGERAGTSAAAAAPPCSRPQPLSLAVCGPLLLRSARFAAAPRRAPPPHLPWSTGIEDPASRPDHMRSATRPAPLLEAAAPFAAAGASVPRRPAPFAAARSGRLSLRRRGRACRASSRRRPCCRRATCPTRSPPRACP